jgi:type II secretory pathway pseudopilin PulG
VHGVPGAPGGAGGFTLLELMLALATATTVAALAVPLTQQSIDELRTAAAARYVAARIAAARVEALRQSRAVALRFEPIGGDYTYAPYADGNWNGIRAADIRDNVDPAIGPFERLSEKFPGVRFALTAGLPDADGAGGTGSDGVRIGTARILTMSSDGTATSGTLYIRGRRGQYAVRVLGVTGRTRVLQYRTGDHSWISR